MRSFNGGFPPWRCSEKQRRRGERRRHPLRNKPWKKELHHQDEPWIRSLERMLQWRKRKRERERERGEHEIEGGKRGEKLNFELCLTRLSFIKVTTSVTYASIYRLHSLLEKHS